MNSSSSSAAAATATAAAITSSRHSAVFTAFTCLLILMCIQQTSGLRGCSSFGHSCFGAHGKRADDVNVDDDVTNYEPFRLDLAVQHRPPLASPTTSSSSSSSSLLLASSPPQSPYIASGRRRIPIALLKLLRNLAEDIDDSTAENRK